MIRRWLLPVVAVALAWLAFRHRAELADVAGTLAHGRAMWVACAVALQLLYYLAYAGLYRAAFRTVGVEMPRRHALHVLLGALALNAVLPGSGAALFVDDAGRRGQSRSRAAAGLLLTTAADFGGLAVLLIASATTVASRGPTPQRFLFAAALVFAVVLGATMVFAIGIARPHWIRAVLGAVGAAIARLTRAAERNPSDWPERATSGFTAASVAIRRQPFRVAGLIGRSLTVHLLDVATLAALFLAFDRLVPPALLVAGYALGLLAWIFSPVPQGIGVVEATFAVVFASFGVPAPNATAIALAFRGLTFWIPLAIGALLLRRLGSLGSRTT
jgi:uncharacterized protein (TIRG00374 family)